MLSYCQTNIDALVTAAHYNPHPDCLRIDITMSELREQHCCKSTGLFL